MLAKPFIPSLPSPLSRWPCLSPPVRESSGMEVTASPDPRHNRDSWAQSLALVGMWELSAPSLHCLLRVTQTCLSYLRGDIPLAQSTPESRTESFALSLFLPSHASVTLKLGSRCCPHPFSHLQPASEKQAHLCLSFISLILSSIHSSVASRCFSEMPLSKALLLRTSLSAVHGPVSPP